MARRKTLKPVGEPKKAKSAETKPSAGGNGNGGSQPAPEPAATPASSVMPDDLEGLRRALLEAESRRAELDSLNERLRSEVQRLRVEVAELRAQVDLVASADPVSGAVNRRAFLDAFRREWQRSRRYGRSLSVIMADIDQFKAINDGYGTEVGDRILRLVAQSFRKTARASDVIGRYGGDSFAIVLPEADLQAARRVAERLRKGLENAVFEHKNRPILVTSSFGVACSEEGDPEPEALLLRADDCLYQAKRGGRNLVVDEES
ncbi:MAG: GGDEF domain-containing protein [Myxococcales bacterium]|nr:GGDEF domain-containing protein [Myxococcales bacterium]